MELKNNYRIVFVLKGGLYIFYIFQITDNLRFFLDFFAVLGIEEYIILFQMGDHFYWQKREFFE